MKKTVVMMIVAIFLIGCSSLEPKRVVNGNVFASDSPKFKLKLDPSFIYLQDLKYADTSKARIESDIILSNKENSYVFVDSDGDNVKKGVVITLAKTSGYWINNPYMDVKRTIEKGKCEIDGNKFNYFTIPVTGATGRITEHITQKGYKLSPGLVRVHGRVPLGNRKYLIEVVYFEAFGDRYDENTVKVWWDAHKGYMSAKEKEILANFNNNSLSAFEILETY